MLKFPSHIAWKKIVALAPSLAVAGLTLAAVPAHAAPIRFVADPGPSLLGGRYRDRVHPDAVRKHTGGATPF